MIKDIQTTLYTEEEVRVSVDEWDDGGVWLGLQRQGSSAYAVLTRDEAQQVFKGLQAILAKEVTA